MVWSCLSSTQLTPCENNIQRRLCGEALKRQTSKWWCHHLKDDTGLPFLTVERLCHNRDKWKIFQGTQEYAKKVAPPFTYTQLLPVLHWMNNLLIQKFTLRRPTMFLLFKNYSLAEVIKLLIRFNKTISFLWNTKDTDRNCVNEQNTHHTERKLTLESVSWC